MIGQSGNRQRSPHWLEDEGPHPTVHGPFLNFNAQALPIKKNNPGIRSRFYWPFPDNQSDQNKGPRSAFRKRNASGCQKCPSSIHRQRINHAFLYNIFHRKRRGPIYFFLFSFPPSFAVPFLAVIVCPIFTKTDRPNFHNFTLHRLLRREIR